MADKKVSFFCLINQSNYKICLFISSNLGIYEKGLLEGGGKGKCLRNYSRRASEFSWMLTRGVGEGKGVSKISKNVLGN